MYRIFNSLRSFKPVIHAVRRTTEGLEGIMEQPSALPSASRLPGEQVLLKVLLACGVTSSLVYAATDILASIRWQGYDWTSRMVSDLFAVSAPTRSFIVVPMLVYNLLILAFGIGVWLRA
jgi:hypothetical protein